MYRGYSSNWGRILRRRGFSTSSSHNLDRFEKSFTKAVLKEYPREKLSAIFGEFMLIPSSERSARALFLCGKAFQQASEPVPDVVTQQILDHKKNTVSKKLAALESLGNVEEATSLFKRNLITSYYTKIFRNAPNGVINDDSMSGYPIFFDLLFSNDRSMSKIRSSLERKEISLLVKSKCMHPFLMTFLPIFRKHDIIPIPTYLASGDTMFSFFLPQPKVEREDTNQVKDAQKSSELITASFKKSSPDSSFLSKFAACSNIQTAYELYNSYKKSGDFLKDIQTMQACAAMFMNCLLDVPEELTTMLGNELANDSFNELDVSQSEFERLQSKEGKIRISPASIDFSQECNFENVRLSMPYIVNCILNDLSVFPQIQKYLTMPATNPEGWIELKNIQKGLREVYVQKFNQNEVEANITGNSILIPIHQIPFYKEFVSKLDILHSISDNDIIHKNQEDLKKHRDFLKTLKTSSLIEASPHIAAWFHLGWKQAFGSQLSSTNKVFQSHLSSKPASESAVLYETLNMTDESDKHFQSVLRLVQNDISYSSDEVVFKIPKNRRLEWFIFLRLLLTRRDLVKEIISRMKALRVGSSIRIVAPWADENIELIPLNRFSENGISLELNCAGEFKLNVIDVVGGIKSKAKESQTVSKVESRTQDVIVVEPVKEMKFKEIIPEVVPEVFQETEISKIFEPASETVSEQIPEPDAIVAEIEKAQIDICPPVKSVKEIQSQVDAFCEETGELPMHLKTDVSNIVLEDMRDLPIAMKLLKNYGFDDKALELFGKHLLPTMVSSSGSLFTKNYRKKIDFHGCSAIQCEYIIKALLRKHECFGPFIEKYSDYKAGSKLSFVVGKGLSSSVKGSPKLRKVLLDTFKQETKGCIIPLANPNNTGQLDVDIAELVKFLGIQKKDDP